MATSRKVSAARRLIKNPLLQRFIIWAAPIVFRYVAKQLGKRRSAGSSDRKYVRNKAK